MEIPKLRVNKKRVSAYIAFPTNVMLDITIGRDGALLHSFDGGHSWYNHDLGTEKTLYGIYFVDDQDGWIVGAGGNIFHTINSGTTWVVQDSGKSYWLQDVFFLNENIGWAVGGYSGIDGIILRTNNGGMTWSMIGEELSGVFLGVHFINEDEGWVVGGVSLLDNFEQEVIWHTSNGGGTWEQQQSLTSGPLIKVLFLNADEGWSVGYNEVVIHTTDGGLNWTLIDVKGPIHINYQFTDVAIPDSNNIWVIDLENIYHSADGGLNWNVEWDWGGIIGPFSYLGLAMVDSIHGWAVGEHIILGYSQDSVSISENSNALLPKETSLGHNYPNPFNSTTIITYELSNGGYISLEIYNILGEKVTTILEGFETPGRHVRKFESLNLASGIYIVHLRMKNFVANRKILLVR